MDWDSVSWADFEKALVEYRDREALRRSPVAGENAYLAIFEELANVPTANRAAHLDSLILFLNRWSCRLPTKTSETREALRQWIAAESRSLETLSRLTLLDSDLTERQPEFQRLYEALIALRTSLAGPRIPTIGDAAASKILHLMVPALFVMWDKEIKKSGFEYAEFLVAMHRFAVRLRDELAPAEARADLEGYLQKKLGYSVRKPLAKYIDEYNWWLAWPAHLQPEPLATSADR